MQYSFIVPVYNCISFLRSCIESICEINLPDSEILLVDDGSTDGSGLLCDTLAREHPEIRVIHQQNGGASAARNTGIFAASGDKILFVDSDDTLDSEALRLILTDPRCAQSDLTIYGMRFDYYHKRTNYRQEPVFYFADSVLTPEVWNTDLLNLFLNNALSSSCNKVFKRDILKKNHLTLDTSLFLYEDFEFVLRYLKYCRTIWNVPKSVYFYRQTEDEGNAGRHLSRIKNIPQFLTSIQASLYELRITHPGIPEESVQMILQQLHQVLAREKIAVSDMKEIRNICRNYKSWEAEYIPFPSPSKFRNMLIAEKVPQLWIAQKKTEIRHRAAVIAKTVLHKIREG